MKRWIIVAALALFAVPAQAQTKADTAAVTRIVRGVYANYGGNGDGGEPAELLKTKRLQGAEDECTAMQGKLDAKEGADTSFGNCSEDYDTFCQCQDTFGTDWKKIKVAVTFPASDRAHAEVTFKAGKPDLRLVFARTAAGWALDDYWEYARSEDSPGEESYRARVIKGVRDMRKQLGMPAWIEPSL